MLRNGSMLRSRSFTKGRLSLAAKRKYNNEVSPSACRPKKHFQSANDTLVGCLDYIEAAEKEASQNDTTSCGSKRLGMQGIQPLEKAMSFPSKEVPAVQVEDHGLSPIAHEKPVSFSSSDSSPIINKSTTVTSKCLLPADNMLNDSLLDSDLLAVHVPCENELMKKDKQDVLEESPKCLKSLSDSGCEGISLDEEEDKQWEDSVYVKPSVLSKDSSAAPKLSTAGYIKSPSSPDQLCDNKTRHEFSLQGVHEINWDESLRLADKSVAEFESPKSSSYSQMVRKKLMGNSSKGYITPLRSKQFQNLSEDSVFFGLPRKVQVLLEKFQGIKDLYEWQKECLCMAESKGKKNLVYALPTSGGKTLVAEILLMKEILINKKNTLFILPYVSIVQEKVRALSLLAVELDFFIEEYAAGKGAYPPKKRRSKNAVYVATIEKALGLVHSLINENRLHEVGLVVADELHLLGEGSRGATLESVLTNLRFAQGDIQIVGMSATIGNLQDIASFLDANTYTGDFRPVELKEYIKCGQTIYQIDRKLIGKVDDSESPLIVERSLESNYSDVQLQNDPDQIGTLVAEVIPDDSCLVFCATRKNCENVALLTCKTMPQSLKTIRVEEKRALFKALAAEGNGQICPILFKTIPYGVAYHHSGLTTAERRLLEEAYLAKTLCVICCTSTLAAGVNLPARRVILRSPYIGMSFIDLSRYKQMVGRAGRAGFGGVGESILMCLPKDTSKVMHLLKSNMTESLSYLASDDAAGLKALVLHSISLRLASCRSDVHAFLKHTLLWVQAKKLGVDVTSLADQCIQFLVCEGAILISNDTFESHLDSNTNVITASVPNTKKNCKEKIIVSLSLSAPLSLSKIGEAAVKGSFVIDTAHHLYNDLHVAQEKLVLLNHLHLLYIVTPYSMLDQIKYDPQVYFNVFMELNAEELKVANALGISEAVIVSVMKRKTIKAIPQEVVDRFYLTLVLYDLWHQKSIWDVSNKFQISRGQVFSLLQAASSFASCVLRFCEVLQEFWCFKVLLEEMVQRLCHCCATELIPLMELPAVKIGRARQLYSAGYRTLRDVASADPIRLIRELDHMPRKAAYQIVAAAKLLLIQKAESLRDEASDFLDGLTLNIKESVTPLHK